MGRLKNCLLSPDKYGKTKEITVVCYDSEGNKQTKPDGSDDTIIFGVLTTATWGDKKELSSHYINFDAITDLKDGVDLKDAKVFNYKEGDEERICFYVKYVRDDDGQRNLTRSDIIALPDEMIAQIDQHIPTMKQILSTVKSSRKKKS